MVKVHNRDRYPDVSVEQMTLKFSPAGIVSLIWLLRSLEAGISSSSRKTFQAVRDSQLTVAGLTYRFFPTAALCPLPIYDREVCSDRK